VQAKVFGVADGRHLVRRPQRRNISHGTTLSAA
jgi:hypothetical protein